MSALMAASAITLAMALALQAYHHASNALARTTNRARALMVLESQAETLRAAGAAALPAPGCHAFPAEALHGLPGATGTLSVEPGPAPGMRQVAMALTWPEPSGPDGRGELVFALSSRGMNP